MSVQHHKSGRIGRDIAPLFLKKSAGSLQSRGKEVCCLRKPGRQTRGKGKDEEVTNVSLGEICDQVMKPTEEARQDLSTDMLLIL